MRKRIIIALLLIFAVVIGVIFLPELLSKEPKYRGKTAQGWFKIFLRTGEGDGSSRFDEALQAMRHLDTNAIVYLINVYYSTNRDSSLRSNVQNFFAKFPILRVPAYLSVEEVSGVAGEVVIKLAPSNDFTFSLVSNRLYSTNSDEKIKTVYLLSSLGMRANEMMPLLRQMLQSTNTNDRKTAAYALFRLGNAAQPAVSELAHLVISAPAIGGRRAPYEAITAFKILSQLGLSASNALPTLRAQLALTKEIYNRLCLAEVICQIDSRDTNAFLTVLQAAKDPTNKFCHEALAGLEMIGAYTRPGNASFESAGEDGRLGYQIQTGYTNEALKTLRLPVRNDNQLERLDAAIVILHFHPTHVTAISTLTVLLRDKDWGRLALAKSARLSHVPLPIKFVLQDFASDPNHELNFKAAMFLEFENSENVMRQ